MRPRGVSSKGEGVAEGNAGEVSDEPLQDDAVVVAVVVQHLQGSLLREVCLGRCRGGLGLKALKALKAGPVQDEGEVTVGLKRRLNVGW